MKSGLKEPHVSYPWGILFMKPTPKQDRVFFTERACMLRCFSRVRLLATLWTIARRLLCPWEFSKQEYWSGLPCPPPGDLPDLGLEPVSLTSPALAGRLFTTSAQWEASSLPLAPTWEAQYSEQNLPNHQVLPSIRIFGITQKKRTPMTKIFTFHVSQWMPKIKERRGEEGRGHRLEEKKGENTEHDTEKE